jgi:hypothetical protein
LNDGIAKMNGQERLTALTFFVAGLLWLPLVLFLIPLSKTGGWPTIYAQKQSASPQWIVSYESSPDVALSKKWIFENSFKTEVGKQLIQVAAERGGASPS